MDKNKSRTDLLAAGRKKLQQFRQKKDSKGNSSKSSSKSGKSGRDKSVIPASEDEATTVKQHDATDGARFVQDVEFYDSNMESIDGVDSVASDIAVAGGLPEKISISAIASQSGTPVLPLEGSGVAQTCSNQSANDRDSGALDKGDLSTLQENAKDNVLNSSNTMIQREKSSDAGTFLSVDHSSNLERQHGAEQVTDVGAMQDVGHSYANQTKGIINQIEGVGSLLSSGFTGAAGYDPVDDSDSATADKEEINVTAQPIESDNTSLTDVVITDPEETQKRQDLSDVSVSSTKTSFASTESSVMNDQPREQLYDSSIDEKAEVFHEADSHLGFHTEGIQPSSEFTNAERFSDFTTDSKAKSLQFREVDLSSVLEGSVVKLSQLADILQLLGEDELRFLFKSKGLPVEKFSDADEMKIHVSLLHDAFERLKEQLYVTNFSKDALYLQLCEQKKLIDEIGVFSTSQVEVKGMNKNLCEEIMRFQNEIHQVVAEREELRRQLQFSKADVEEFSVKANELQNKLEMAQKEISSLSSELADCRNLVESLQAENEQLNESFKLMTEEREKLLKDNRNIMLDNEKYSGELAQSKASLESLQALLRDEGRSHELVGIKSSKVGLQVEHNKSLDALQEATIHTDQLIKENERLHANLDFYKCKLKEIDQKNSHFGEAENQEVRSDIGLMLKPRSDLLSLEPLKVNVYDDSSGFFTLKRNLGNAEMVMRKLENEIESLLLHSTSCRSTKAGSPKVSRLIQAFESKGHVDDQDPEKSHALENPEKSPAFENQTTEDLYMRTKMATSNLRVLLEGLVNDADNASEFCKVMRNILHNDAANKSDSMREHADQVEAANIELMVLYEVTRSDINHAVANERQLLNLCDNLQKQELILKSENSDLRQKLNNFEIKMTELHEKLDWVCRDSDEKVTSISNELQTLQAEVIDKELILEQKWNAAFSQILHAVGELDSTSETYANSFATGQSNLDVIGHVVASVHSTRKLMEDLRGQLEVAYRDRQEALDKSDMALNTLHKLYNDLSELVPFGHHQNATQNFVADNVLDFLHSDVLNTLLDQLRRLFGERLQLESENKQLQAELMARSMEMDHLDKRCLKPNTVDKLVEEIEHSLMLEGTEIDADEFASRLESLIYLLVQKFKEANQGMSISKSLKMQLSGLQGQVDHLNSVLVQYENENLVLKQSLRSTEEEITALNSMVKEKGADLEQSELRVSSLREKLSIAVTKGKGLISQRDSLKQSLAETSKELEKCSQELLSKDARLHELETKLRVYSEAGERMEALESELSYIRNSATALRESFLLKDSVLQRIEEILEDLELPEHFHSSNVIEKIEWLAKSVGENSLHLGDWDQRSSAGGPTCSTVGFVGVEGLKDDIQSNPDFSDDFRRKYEDLENKFYGLAEQNEMLEQSLMDMNNLVQRWEGLLNGMDMPSQLRSIEPEDKIQWLKTAWSEAQNHCYSLQLEIDNLETYCGSLTADMEDSHRRASELVAAFQMACVEKEILSRDLEVLGHENERILENSAYLVSTNENLQNEVSMFQEEKLQNEHSIRRLEKLVCDALQDNCTEQMILDREGVKYLENMLGKLVEKCKTLLKEKPESVDPINVQDTDKGQLSHTSRDFEEQNVKIVRKKLEDSLAEQIILKDEKDQYMRNNQSALRKVEELEAIKNEMEEQLYQVELESTSFRETLGTTLDDFTGELAILKVEKDRYKMDNQSLLSEVEELEATKKELQELLNQEELKSASMRETLNKKLDDCMVELTILKEEQARYTISNQSLHHEVEELEMKKKELEELLHREKLNSACLQELLNQEGQKSFSFREASHHQVEELEMKKKELQELLHKEELKSASLQELLNQEEQKSFSFRESSHHQVEELEMKKKELRELLHKEELKSASLQELLNQEEQKSFSFGEALHKKLEDYSSELEILKGEKDKLELSNQSLLQEVEELEMKKKELQQLLHQEELKSASLQELLNQEEQKSFSFGEALHKKLEDYSSELEILKGEKDKLELSNQSLLQEVEELEMKKKELQQLLHQEELKSASLKELLNQEEQKSFSFGEALHKKLEDYSSELEILKGEKDKLELSNQSLLQEVEELEMKKKELQQLLHQEELKSASLQELLNQEEQKSFSFGEALHKKLEDYSSELEILKGEKDKLELSNQSLFHEVEELEMKKKELQQLLHQEGLKSASLQELLKKEEQKSFSFGEALHKKLEDYSSELEILKGEKDELELSNQSLLDEVEDLEMKKKELQQLLHQEELKSASLQELLNQEEQKSFSFGEALHKKLEDYSSELEILKGEKDKLELSNQSVRHEVEELEMKKKELQQLLHQEELKSASLTEALNKRLQDSTGEMMILTNEKDRLMQDNQSLLSQIEDLEMKKKELQGLLNQEEQKSSSLKEKLNLAVRKGKSLVQQRDSMKQVIEELNAEVERLKSETKHAEKAISEYEGQTKNFVTVQERLQVLESEGAFLKNRLEETESSLLKKEDTWNRILEALENIDLGVAFSSRDPVEKLKEISKYLTDLRAQMDSLKEESRKSKRASELLLAELNEVQERNDGLQEELEKTFHDLSELSREKDLTENARREALEQIEKLSQAHIDKDRQMSEIMALRSGVDSMREDLSSIERELSYVLSQDFEVLQNLKSLLNSLLESGGISDFGVLFPESSPWVPGKSENKVFMTEVSSIRELLSNHSQLLQTEASQLHEVLMNVHTGYTFYKEACESAKQDINKLELIEKVRESELHILRGNVSLLYETCVSSISEIENGKDRLAGNALPYRSPESKLKSQLPIEGWNSSTNDITKFSEEAIRNIQAKLLFAVRDIISMQNDLVDVGQREMKNTILNLQKEIQEKDVQRDRVCTELVNQVKAAETSVKNHLNELQQVRVQLHDSQKQLSVMEEKHKVLEQRMKELQDQEMNSKDLQQKVNSLTDALAAKVQETEALVQALDAQEAEMEDLTNKVASLEYELLQKNKGVENLETSRAKALKKLSVTVSKFDELHSFSESLLSEVEKLQSQVQERDEEISFLRQEVTRCTNNALSITELSKSSDEVHDLLSWMDSLISRAQMNDITADAPRSQPIDEYKEAVQKKFLDLVSELENLRMEVQKNGILLRKERSKIEDLAQKEQYLKNSLHEKETQLAMLQEAGDSTAAMKSPSEIVEVEQRSNKRVSSGAVTSQVRSLRKTNSDQVAIAIDVDNNNDRLEEDDDKAHGFKSLTTSKFVPRFTRPVSDLVDGLWVSCDRALMRQPALRLCVMMYWAILHAMLATFFV